MGYPTHDFVIDKKEANELFNNIRDPEKKEQEILDTLQFFIKTVREGDNPLILMFTKIKKEQKDKKLSGKVNEEHNGGIKGGEKEELLEADGSSKSPKIKKKGKYS